MCLGSARNSCNDILKACALYRSMKSFLIFNKLRKVY